MFLDRYLSKGLWNLMEDRPFLMIVLLFVPNLFLFVFCLCITIEFIFIVVVLVWQPALSDYEGPHLGNTSFEHKGIEKNSVAQEMSSEPEQTLTEEHEPANLYAVCRYFDYLTDDPLVQPENRSASKLLSLEVTDSTTLSELEYTRPNLPSPHPHSIDKSTDSNRVPEVIESAFLPHQVDKFPSSSPVIQEDQGVTGFEGLSIPSTRSLEMTSSPNENMLPSPPISPKRERVSSAGSHSLTRKKVKIQTSRTSVRGYSFQPPFMPTNSSVCNLSLEVALLPPADSLGGAGEALGKLENISRQQKSRKPTNRLSQVVTKPSLPSNSSQLIQSNSPVISSEGNRNVPKNKRHAHYSLGADVWNKAVSEVYLSQVLARNLN